MSASPPATNAALERKADYLKDCLKLDANLSVEEVLSAACDKMRGALTPEEKQSLTMEAKLSILCFDAALEFEP